MSNRKLVVSLFLVLLLGVSSCGKLSSVTGIGGNSALSDMQSSMSSNFYSAMVDVMEAQAKLLEALGYKEKADKLIASRETLSKGNTSQGDKEASKKLSDEANAIIQADMSKLNKLSDEQLKLIKAGLVSFASGNLKASVAIYETVQFSKEMASAIKSDPKSAPLLSKQLVSGVYIVKELPSFVKNNAAVISIGIDLLKKNNVDTKDLEKQNEKAKKEGAE